MRFTYSLLGLRLNFHLPRGAAGCLLALGLFAGLTAAYAFLVAHLLMWLWSMSLVPIFHMRQLDFWAAIGLLLLLAFVGGFFTGNGGEAA